ncbi:hypothetical protein HDE_06883 [Halotydeus destructor]|nr:hypothetical protein HDE_06883 [Halotydeus destructor]
MPERGTHYLWPDNIPRSADQYVGDNEAVRSKQSSKLDPQLAGDGERSEADSVKEEAEAVAAILSSMEQGGDESSPQSSLDGKASMVSEVKWSSGARGTNGPVGGKGGNVLPRIYQSRPMSMTSGSGGSDGGHWRVSSSSLGKRGPECMRKCIAQGVLHPVQCHSLC